MNEFEKKIRESEPILKIVAEAREEFPLKKEGAYNLYPTTWSDNQNRENLTRILDWFEKWLENEDKS